MTDPQFVGVTSRIAKLDLALFGGAMRVGVWLVQGDHGWTLIDTGSPGDAATIDRAARQWTGGTIPTRIILTHGHYDHAGSARALAERWAIPVLAHRAEEPFLLGKAAYGSVRPAWWAYRLFQLVASLAAPPSPLPRVDLLAEGEVVDGLEVCHVPGHAPGMIALIHRLDRAVIAGDTFVSKGGQLYPPVGIFTADPAEARRSMQKLASADVDHVLPSHGQPILHRGKLAADWAVRQAGS